MGSKSFGHFVNNGIPLALEIVAVGTVLHEKVQKEVMIGKLGVIRIHDHVSVVSVVFNWYSFRIFPPFIGHERCVN